MGDRGNKHTQTSGGGQAHSWAHAGSAPHLPTYGLAQGPWWKSSWFARSHLVRWHVSVVPKKCSKFTVSLEFI